MVGFGLGFGSRSMSRQYSALGQNVRVSALRPSAQWNGTAGSGFAGFPPVDPARTTAKPACRLLVPPNQYFTDELVIGVWAGANNQGSLLDDLGLDRVIVHCEGERFAIEAPTFYLFEDPAGNVVRYFGWWAVLQHPGMHGHAHVYFEAVPKNPAMQSRVIGPYQFSPQPAVHDFQLEIAPSQAVIAGARYQSFQAAMNYLRTAGAQNPRITVIEAGNYDFVGIAGVYSGQGYCTIDASVPITIKKPGFSTGAAALIRCGYDGLWFRGPNITVDFRYAAYIYHENAANRDHVFEGVNFTDSGGRYYTYMLGQKPTLYIARDKPWYLECNIGVIQNPCANANLVRGCTLHGGNGDVASSALCVIGNTIRDWTSEEWRTPLPALSLQYSGAGATATLELAGGNEAGTRTFTAKVAGTTVGTFTVLGSEAAFLANTNYTVANVAAWLNSLSGWSATVLDNTRRATSLGKTGTSGTAFAATNVKTSVLTLATIFDQHVDLWALSSTSNQNVIFADNLCHNYLAQSVYLSPPGGGNDIMVVNNCFDLDQTDIDFGPVFSQLGDVCQHVVVAHNSWSNQQLLLRSDAGYNPDSYCLIANNIAPTIAWQAGGSDADMTIRDNHLFDGASIPAGAIGTTIGGTRASLFVNPGNGDFGPQGALLGIMKNPSLRYDRLGAARPAPGLLGAMAGPAAAAPAITSGNPSGVYPENAPISGTLTANKPVTWSVQGVDASFVTVDAATGAWSLQATDFESKTSYAFTFSATDSSLDTAAQVVAITLSDLDEIAPLLSTPSGTANGTSGATLAVSTSENNGTLFWYVSASAIPPTKASLAAGIGAVAGGSQTVSAAGSHAATVSGLAAGTAYYPYFLHRDGAGNDSEIASGGSFSTSAASGGNVAVINSAVVLKATDALSAYTATPFEHVGGAGRVLIAVVSLCQHAAQALTDVTVDVNGTAMVRLAGGAHSGGATRPIAALFAIAGQAAGSKTIDVAVVGGARSCSVLAMEVDGLDTANLLSNSLVLQSSSLTYSHSYTPTDAGNLMIAILATRYGDRGPFTPDAGMIKLQDDSTGSSSNSDHSVFVGYGLAAGTSAANVGATTAANTEVMFVVAELKKA